MTPSTVDKRALRILYSTYWSASGWKKEHEVSPSDLAYAKKAGLMFDPVCLSHDQAVERAIKARAVVSKEQVVNHFLVSLTTRRLDLRSALGSFAVARNLPVHAWDKSDRSTRCCPVCGIYENSEQTEDISVLNFERFKWGGVRHDSPIYIGFDLQEVAQQPTQTPTTGDLQIMANILEAARSMPPDAKLSQLQKKLASILRSNTNERRTLIGILGYCGILKDPWKPDFFTTFPHFYARKETPWVKDDWPYPVRWWRSSFGVAEKAIAFWFPAL